MNDHLKDTCYVMASAVGFIGSISLTEVSAVVSIICGVSGTIAAWVAICRKNKQ